MKPYHYLFLGAALFSPTAHASCILFANPQSYASSSGSGENEEEYNLGQGLADARSVVVDNGSSDSSADNRPSGDVGAKSSAQSVLNNFRAVSRARSVSQFTVESGTLGNGVQISANVNFAVDGSLFISGGNTANNESYGPGSASAEMNYSFAITNYNPFEGRGFGCSDELNQNRGIASSSDSIVRYEAQISISGTRNTNSPNNILTSGSANVGSADLVLISQTEGITVPIGSFLGINDYVLTGSIAGDFIVGQDYWVTQLLETESSATGGRVLEDLEHNRFGQSSADFFNTGTINLNDPSGQTTLNLTALNGIPEPSSLILGSLGLSLLIRRRR